MGKIIKLLVLGLFLFACGNNKKVSGDFIEPQDEIIKDWSDLQRIELYEDCVNGPFSKHCDCLVSNLTEIIKYSEYREIGTVAFSLDKEEQIFESLGNCVSERDKDK